MAFSELIFPTFFLTFFDLMQDILSKLAVFQQTQINPEEITDH
jgi:hypothetical protein